MTLRIYPVVLELVRKLAPCLPVLRARSASLGDQLERALISIPLNLAEAAYSRGRIDRPAVSPLPLPHARPWLASRPQRRSAGPLHSTQSSALYVIA